MNLNLILPIKKIQIGEKTISIPKLGLKHHNLLKELKGPDESLAELMDSISPGLNDAETNIVLIHLLEFNGKLKSEVEKDGVTYKISDVYICQRLTQQFGGNTFVFRSPNRFEKFFTPDDVLEKCFLRVNDSEVIPDFMDMPAFVTKWADDITTTIAVPGKDVPIKGITAILELFE